MRLRHIVAIQFTLSLLTAASLMMLQAMVYRASAAAAMLNVLEIVPMITLVTLVISAPVSRFMIKRKIVWPCCWLMMGLGLSQLYYMFYQVSVVLLASPMDEADPGHMQRVHMLYTMGGVFCGAMFEMALVQFERRVSMRMR